MRTVQQTDLHCELTGLSVLRGLSGKPEPRCLKTEATWSYFEVSNYLIHDWHIREPVQLSYTGTTLWFSMHQYQAHESVHEVNPCTCTLTDTRRWKTRKPELPMFDIRSAFGPPPKNLSWLSVTSFAAADEPRPNAKASIHTINKNENDGFNNPLLHKHKSEIPLQRKYETRIVYRRKRDICPLSWLKEIPLWIQFILPEKT